MIIQFIRHMETNMNKAGVFQGSIDAELSDKGKADSVMFSERVPLDFDALHCSELQRARYLANLLETKSSRSVTVDSRLNEIRLGEWEGKTWKEITIDYEEFLKEWFIDNVNIPAPKGESYKDLQVRIQSFFNDLVKEDVEKVVIVTHGAWIKTMVCTILDIPLTKRSTFNIDNGTITEVHYTRGKYQLNKLNVDILT